jgi:UDP-N-acetylglucosamine:LPS N-acetylglucosamine transferase
MTELLALMQHMHGWPAQPSVYVTTREVWAGRLRQLGTTYVIGEADRHKPLQGLQVVWRALMLVVKERPDVIVTTGSLPIAIVCVWGRLFGARSVWIDSIAQIDDLSMSGKLMRRVADLCLTQWPGVAAKYPDVVYVGELQ